MPRGAKQRRRLGERGHHRPAGRHLPRSTRREIAILAEWKQHPGLGPSQVRNRLRRRGIKVAAQTARRVMEDTGCRPPKVNREPHDKRSEAVRPSHLWRLDFVHRHINRATAFTRILIDDPSRYVVGHGVDDAERAAMVIDTFEAAVRRHGKPAAVMHDRGEALHRGHRAMATSIVRLTASSWSNASTSSST